MGQIIINTGNIANDGTGAPLRTAFTDTNYNFTQLFAAGPAGSNITIANNTIQVTNTNGNLRLATNGTGVVVPAANFVPDIPNVRSIGLGTNRFTTVYAQYINAATGTFSGNVYVDGNLQVTGNVVTVDYSTLSVANSSIILATGAANAAQANGGGLLIPIANANLTYNYSANTWDSTIAVTAPTFVGDGANLTNVIANVQASALLGSTFSNSINYSNLTSFGLVTAISATGNISTTGNVYANTFTGNTVSANYISGDGSRITNITANAIVGNVPFAVNAGSAYTANLAALATQAINADTALFAINANLASWANTATIAQTANASHYAIQADNANSAVVAGMAYELSPAANLSIAGNITTGGYFIGDGGLLSNVVVTTSYGNSNVTTLLGAFGSNTINTTGAISVGDVSLTNIYSPNYFANAIAFANANGYITTSSLFKYNPETEVITVGAVSATGNITANYFIGNGSQLTGLAATYGNSNVESYLQNLSTDISTSGNVTAANISATDLNSNSIVYIGANGLLTTDSAFTYIDNGGELTLNVDYLNSPGIFTNDIYGQGNLILHPDVGNNFSAYLDVYLTGGPDIHIAANSENVIIGRDSGANVTVGVDGNVTIQADAGTPHKWTFGTDGTLSVPGAVNYQVPGLGGSGHFDINSWYPVNLTVNDGVGLPFQTWNFDNTGMLTLPGGGTITSALGSPQDGLWLGYNGHRLLLNSDGQFWTGGIALGGNALPGYVGSYGNITLNANIGTGPLERQWVFDTDGSMIAPGDISATGNVTAANFVTSGAQGNITGANVISAITFSATGDVNANNISAIGNITGGTANLYAVDISQSITWTGGSQVYEDSALVLNGPLGVAISSPNAISIVSNSQTWAFDTDGSLTIPRNILAEEGNDLNVQVFNPDVSGGVTYTVQNRQVDLGNARTTQFEVAPANIILTTDFSGNRYQWNFDNTGNLTLPVGGNLVLASGSIVGDGASPAPTLSGFDSVSALTLSASGNVTGGNLITSGSGGNITMTGGNITGANVVTANAFVGSLSYLANNAGIFTLLGDNTLLSGTVASPQNFKVSDAYTPDIDMRNASGTGTFTQGATSYTIRVAGSNNLVLDNTGKLSAPGAISAVGNITGNYILGNGSQLTNLPAPTVTYDNTSNGYMDIMTYDGNIKYVSTATIEPSSGNIHAAGNISAAGNVTANTFVGSGSGLTNVAQQTTGAWTVTAGTNNYSFTVNSGTYNMWVTSNIPNGIIAWNATATVTNTNVPVVGQQYAWVYNGGGTPLDFVSIPNQFIGTANSIVRSNVAPSSNTNTFTFSINNTSGNSQIVNWGYTKL